MTLTRSAAQAIVARAFPASPLTVVVGIEELVNLTFNAIYILTLSTGVKAVVKIAPPPAEVRVLLNDIDILAVEAAVLRVLSAATTKKHALLPPVPELLLFDDAADLVDAPYVLLSHIDGTPATSANKALVEGVLRQLAAIKPIKREFGKVRGGGGYRSWSTAFGALVEAALRDGEDIVLLLPYAAVRAAVRNWADVLDDVKEPRLAVVDFCEDSVLLDPTGGVAGVIDFERAVWGDPGLARLYREGVVEAEGMERRERVRRLLYAAYHSIVRILETFYYGGSTEEEMRERRRLVMCLRKLEELREQRR